MRRLQVVDGREANLGIVETPMPDESLIEAGPVPLEQTVLECAPGRPVLRATGDAEEVLFVLSGAGSLHVGGEQHELQPESGAYLPPGTDYEVRAAAAPPLRLVSVRVPDPPGASDAQPPGVSVRHLAEQEAKTATTDREFRIIADPEHGGLRSATHFVGYIPAAKAPDHFHTYDEVIYVLDGEGTFHADGRHAPLHAGSRIHLPARTVHCLENTGTATMRVVAVFRPAGSPAAAYYPDGTPAYPGAPPVTAS
jgi:quercetin dioxygenase-like cupin family protein